MSALHAVAIPKWGIEMIEGTVASWLSGEGDHVDKGDEICEIESDKIVNALEAPASGVLLRVIASEGDTCKVGALIGVIGPEGTDATKIDEFVAAYVVPEHSGDRSSDSETPDESPAAAAPSTGGSGGSRRISPVIRRLANDLGVDLDTVTGSGRNGRITREDVERAASGDADGPAETDSTPANPSTVHGLSGVQKTAARRLLEAKQTVPHFYLHTDVNVDRLLTERERLGGAVSVNDLLIVCTAQALRAVPDVNAHFVDDEVHRFEHADIALAVATERGLLTPVLRRVETLSPAEVASASKALIERARSARLERGELDGATFTVSNLGMFGVSQFEAIINPPQVAILALGEAAPRAVVVDDDVTTASVLTATLSCDHRVVDGALGARFLGAFRDAVEQFGNSRVN